MTADLERRIARVLVGSQHPGLPPGKVDELVTLGVGQATAALIVEEIQAWERERYGGNASVRPSGAERLGPIRHEPARPEPVTPAEVARLTEVLEAVAAPDHDSGRPAISDTELQWARAAKRARWRR